MHVDAFCPQIMSNVKNHNYQIACARYFESTHKAPAGSFNVNHPNQYFEDSEKYLKADEGATFSSLICYLSIIVLFSASFIDAF